MTSDLSPCHTLWFGKRRRESGKRNGCTQYLRNSSPEPLVAYAEFFDNAPAYNPRAEMITGSVCGVKVEGIQDPLMKKIRQLDKLVDELAKGKPMEKIKR